MPSLIKLNSSNKKCTINQFVNLNRKILILRKCGGYGDILNMRMIFQDLKQKYPEFEFDWALPSGYFPAAHAHPYVNKLVDYNDFKESDYLCVYNLTHCCSRYEWATGNLCDKNRSDIWSEYIGLKLENHELFMPDYSELFPTLKQKLFSLGWDGNKKLVFFAPKSASIIKNLTLDQCKLIKNITKDFFLFIVHNVPILDLISLGVPFLTNISLKESMAAVQMSDYVVSTDTGHLHCAGGYRKPSVGIFCYTNGDNISRYYKTIEVVQGKHIHNNSFCGPCNNYGTCKVSNNEFSKPCMEAISNDMIYNAWKKAISCNK